MINRLTFEPIAKSNGEEYVIEQIIHVTETSTSDYVEEDTTCLCCGQRKKNDLVKHAFGY